MKRSILSVLLGLALSAVGFLLAARYIKQPPSVTTYWPIAAGIGVMLAAWLLQGAVIALLSRPQTKSVKILDMTKVYLATQSAGAITPFAGGEIAYQLLELDRRGMSSDYSGAVITLRSILNGIPLMIGAIVGLFFVPHVPFLGKVSSLRPSEHKYVIGAAIVIAAVGALVALIVAYVRRRSRRRREQEGSKDTGPAAKVSGKTSEYYGKIKGYFRDMKDSLVLIWSHERWVVIASLGLMSVYWAIYPLLGTMALRAAGWDGTGWAYVYLAQFVLFIVIPLAPTPGNSGAAELAFVALMGDYAPKGALLGGVIIWRVLNHYSELVVGSFIAGRSLPEDVKIAKRMFGSNGSKDTASDDSGSGSDGSSR